MWGDEINDRVNNRKKPLRPTPAGEVKDPLPIVQSSRMIYYDAAKNVYWARDAKNEWYSLRRGDLYLRWRLEGFRPAGFCENGLTQLENETVRIQEEQRVEWAGKLAGYNAGFHVICNQPILIVKGPTLPQPKPGKWDTLKKYLGELLGVEVVRFWAWIRAARESLKAGFPWRPGQALVLAGPPGCGKSLLQGIITEILGGRVGRPFRYMAEKTDFNVDLFGSEHLVIEDEQPFRDASSRRLFGVGVKNFLVNETQSFHPKGKDALSMTPFWRMSISLNDEPEDLQVLPPLDDAVKDKMTLLRCFRVEFPFETGSPKERHAFRQKLSQEIPAFLDFVRKWRVPKGMQDVRYGVTAFHDPSLVEALENISSEIHLYHMILSAKILPEDGGAWRGIAADLDQKLRDHYRRGELDRMLSWPAALGVFLGRLAKLKPDCVQFEKFSSEGQRVWLISRGGLTGPRQA